VKKPTMKFVPLIFVSLLILIFPGISFAQETSHYDFVAEFIKELGDTKISQDIATREMAETKNMGLAEKNQETMMSIIRNGTRVKLKLRENNNMLKAMNLKDPFEKLIPALIYWNEQKIKLYDELIKISKTFLEGPKSNVNYAKLAARMPELTASMEYVDESIFKLTPMVFMLLIDQKPDSQNHLSHLTITKDEGQKLSDKLNNYFASSMDEKNQNWTVSSASVLRTYLTEKGYKFSDDQRE
jgi:hypothetical protein